MGKVRESVEQALEGIEDGASIMVGGFGLCGNAEALIRGVVEKAPKELTLISNNAGNLGKGLAAWLNAGLIRKIFCTYVGNNEDLHRMMADGTVDVTILPQGTFVERMRAAGAGIPAFFTPTGVGTVVAEGKEIREFDGREYVLEEALHADFALIRAAEADPFGNLRFYRTARNFSPIMATAAKTTVVECDQLVGLGEIDPDDVHLPGAFVQRVLPVAEHEDAIEYRTTRPRPEGG
ncbi:MAG TPA: CoA transferase subunit A [Polyangiaceae bacterium LLY-WYZ-15_(1-7)]|nr:succinyl-CoA--3-ketoacid-CoA transferase [Sandaracinus sp.]HJK89680.1 CoA transferase subunit A [Polyangiaceae bacterium LLY-WYZ-15_(1-7)]MBJ73370.1 succinyl-CoA--3-ketoacid-CoA transferase [Sandaracinus sp.]HJL01494.1 CoA transferase subunit A [Polyangiaceae bacterium LLY-WYZ-15_(1-7)]HJL11951.1 CoA transferase subunit A [Polyangiaceae bacterium LLY-WYZ-15_(1-7)]